jgi:hypothetical protein
MQAKNKSLNSEKIGKSLILSVKKTPLHVKKIENL